MNKRAGISLKKVHAKVISAHKIAMIFLFQQLWIIFKVVEFLATQPGRGYAGK